MGMCHLKITHYTAVLLFLIIIRKHVDAEEYPATWNK